MGRNNQSLKYQINQLVNNQLRIGQKKVKNGNNPNWADGIHSIKTADTYRASVNQFGDWLKDKGVKNISQITDDQFKSYLKERNSKNSAYTTAKDVSAINKVFGTSYTVHDLGLKRRNHNDITNNRGFANHRSMTADQGKICAFISSCGIRRQSIGTLTPNDAIRDSKGSVLGFNVVEKGGKKRNCYVLKDKQGEVTQIVNKASTEHGSNTPIFAGIDKNVNVHWYRGEYAQNLYNALQEAHNNHEDYYNGYRDLFINQANMDLAMQRYENRYAHGYDLSCLAEVSQNLGHNRIDVVIYHYIGK